VGLRIEDLHFEDSGIPVHFILVDFRQLTEKSPHTEVIEDRDEEGLGMVPVHLGLKVPVGLIGQIGPVPEVADGIDDSRPGQGDPRDEGDGAVESDGGEGGEGGGERSHSGVPFGCWLY